jgi:2-oxo-3-hexenedioate decarboxylase
VTDARTIADTLIEAERERRPIAPFSRAYPFLDAETAYKAQAMFVENRLRTGESLMGAKLGMTSNVKRRALGIHEPVYGRLTSGMVLPYGEPVPEHELINPRAEPEIAFLLGERIETPATVNRVLRAVEAVFGAIEIMDSRYAQPFRLFDSVADNAGAARLVLGSRGRTPDELADLRVLGCVFRGRNTLATAAGGAAMGHPAAAVAWLVNALARRGEHLAAGSIVLSGGLTASVPVRGSGVVSAEFDGLESVMIHC